MNVLQVSIGRFHHFHLARQLQKHGLLDSIYTGYPRFQLKDEQGIPNEKIRTFPWLQAPFMMRRRIGLDKWKWLNREWAWLAHQSLDQYVARQIHQPLFVVALSGSGLRSGKKAQQYGGKHICDRGSSHIRYQDQILKEEYKRWDLPFAGVDPRSIEKEEREYVQADIITVPSGFVKRSFIEMGVPADKLAKVTYGARLDRFSKTGEPVQNKFVVLWVGGVTIRKGFMYLLHAFQKLKYPNKELLVIGVVSEEIKSLLRNENLDGVVFKGTVQNAELPAVYSSANVFVLPSIEEGLAMVQGEALACGCPVIASANTGSEDIITDGVEGFVIPIRSSESILLRLEQLSDQPHLREEMSVAAQQRTRMLGGWDAYGENFVNMLKSLNV